MVVAEGERACHPGQTRPAPMHHVAVLTTISVQRQLVAMIRSSMLLASSAFALSCGRLSTQPACHAPDDVSAQYVGVVRVTLANERFRQLWRLPQVKPAEVRPVTDPSVCAQANLVGARVAHSAGIAAV